MAKGVKRTAEEISQTYDTKIQYHESQIEKLKGKIKELEGKVKGHNSQIKQLNKDKEKALNPTPRVRARSTKRGLTAVVQKAKEMGLTPQEMAEKLGFSLDV